MKGERMVSSIFALAEAEADGWAKVRYIADQKFSYIDTPFPWEKWSMEHLLVLNKGVERGSCILWEDYYDSVIFALNGDIEIALSSLFDRKYFASIGTIFRIANFRDFPNNPMLGIAQRKVYGLLRYTGAHVPVINHNPK